MRGSVAEGTIVAFGHVGQSLSGKGPLSKALGRILVKINILGFRK